MLIGKQVERLVEGAMKEQAPELWRSLRASGQLATFLESKAEEIAAMEEEISTPELFKIAQSNLGTLERQRQATEVQRQAWEQALSVCLTFPEATTTASPMEG